MAPAPDFAEVAGAVATALELPVGAVTPDALVIDTWDDSLALYCAFVALDGWTRRPICCTASSRSPPGATCTTT